MTPEGQEAYEKALAEARALKRTIERPKIIVVDGMVIGYEYSDGSFIPDVHPCAPVDIGIFAG